MVRNGLYGSGEVRRQRWRCVSPDGAKHNFAGVVVRTVLTEPSTCETCEQHVETHQGPGVASRYRFPVFETALALVRVGRGMTYSEAARRAKVRTARGAAPTAQLVGNWIEVFGPVIAEQFRETSWPETVVLDSTALHANQADGGAGVVFSLHAAYGYDPGSTRGRLVALHAAPGAASQATWRQFLRSLPGQPRLVVTDQDAATIGAVRSAFPSSTIRLCRWHLKRNLSQAINPIIGKDRAHPLAVAAETAFDDQTGWTAFKELVATLDRPVLDRWVKGREQLLSTEFAATDLPDHWGNGSVEQVLNLVRGRLARRAFCFRNAERTNRMLELVRIHLNREDDAGRYATAIRQHLTTNGRPSHQLTIKDPAGAPSLR